MRAYDFSSLPKDIEVVEIAKSEIPAEEKDKFKRIVYKDSKVSEANKFELVVAEGFKTSRGGHVFRRSDDHLVISQANSFTTLPLYHIVGKKEEEKAEELEKVRKLLEKGYVMKGSEARSVTVYLPLELGNMDIIGLYGGRVCMLGRKGGKCYVVQGYGNPIVSAQNMKKD